MGEAKRKAKTFEERKALAITRNAEAEAAHQKLMEEQKAKYQAWWDGLSQEEKDKVSEQLKKRAEARRLLTMAASIARRRQF